MDNDRKKALDGLADGLVSRGVPVNLAKQTVELIYQMGRLDERTLNFLTENIEYGRQNDE